MRCLPARAIGAIHSVVIRRLLSPSRLPAASRIATSTFRDHLPTRSAAWRKRRIPLKDNTDKAVHIAARGRRRGQERPGGRAVPAARSTGSRPAVTSGAARDQEGGRASASPKDEGRGSAVHPLHIRLDRQAEGRAAHNAAAISSTHR